LLVVGGIAGISTIVFAIVSALSPQITSTSVPVTSTSVPGVNFVVDPPTLRVCDPLTIAKVSWNAANAGIERVDIFVLGEDAHEKLFLAWREAAGSANTGPWVGHGSVFVLRDNVSKKQLAKFTVGSQSCN
jgi:hypothetical protein